MKATKAPIPTILALLALLAAGCGSQGDGSVSVALAHLLTQHNIQHGQITCVHVSGSTYQCAVTQAGVQRTVAVTDDGTNIAEIGIPAP